MDLGLPELIIILLIVLLLFGSSRLPQLSRSIGQSLKELREGFGNKESASEDKNTEPSENEKTKTTEDKNAKSVEEENAEHFAYSEEKK